MEEKDYERNFRQDVKINRLKLEEECEGHSSIYLYWNEQLAEARSELDKAKNKLKYLKVERELHFRNFPKGGLKATEGSVKAMVDDCEQIRDARGERTRLQKDYDILAGAVSAMEHRRTQLSNLKDLLIAGFYSYPGGKKTSTDLKQDHQRKRLNKKEDEDE